MEGERGHMKSARARVQRNGNGRRSVAACDEEDDEDAGKNSRHFCRAARSAHQSDLNRRGRWWGPPDLVAPLKRTT